MSTEPGDIKPLPPATKPTLPPAPKLSLAGGMKPSFKPDGPAMPAAPAAPDPFALETARPAKTTTPTIAAAAPKTPTIGAATPAATAPAAAAAPATPAASRAPVIQAQKSSLSSIKAVDDAEVPVWHAALSGFGLVASIAAVTLLFLELKPTL